jgi:hypothetical protein
MRRLLPVLIAFLALPPTADAAWVWPVSGEVITPYRNGTDPYATGQHRGIDISAPVGAPVVAAAGGDVRFAGTAGSSGVTISIRTGDGYDTSYLHLSALDVRAGSHVSAGDRIGAVGTTGSRSALAPHLHFGVRDAGTRHAYHDPLAFLPPAPPARPTPEPPTPAPAPRPAPTPPSPMPAPAPHAAPGSRRAPTPRLAPGSRRAPIPHAAPRSRPAPTPRLAPGSRRAPIPRAAPRPSRRRLPLPAASPRPLPIVRRSPHPALPLSPRLNPFPKDAPRAHASPEMRKRVLQPLRAGPLSADPTPARARVRGGPDGGGPDIGLVLACTGLLLAAGVLGLTEDGRRATTRTRSRLLAALPAFGRR